MHNLLSSISRPSAPSLLLSRKPIQLSPKLHSPSSLPPRRLSNSHNRHPSLYRGDQRGEEELLPLLPSNRILKDLSTWGIGGPVKYFADVSTESQLLSAAKYCRANSIRFLVIGRGSNCLFDDLGFDGCIILNSIAFLQRLGDGLYRAGSGYPFNRLGVQCSNEGFSGLEFAGGVPCTVGGAVFMNAGAHGQETADAVDSVEIVTIDGSRRVLYRYELEFGYRTSQFQRMEDLTAIVAVTFRLRRSSSARSRQQKFLQRRRKSQPTRERTAGSVFRNPTEAGVPAAELIEKAGLKGVKVGGAKVSDLHANFFINYNGSTSKDMIDLVNLVKHEVDRKFGIRLMEEIRYVAFNDHQMSTNSDSKLLQPLLTPT